jgi:HAD superfamily phosphoserine phosphatase-like hydrolase
MKSIVLDFDGTMTRTDVGNEICERFAPPAWRALEGRWLRRELTLPEAQRQMWALVRASRVEIDAFVQEIGALRAGLEPFVRRARRAGHRVVIASGGFDFYIGALVAPLGPVFDEVICNGARLVGAEVTPLFREGLSCPACAVCKARVCAGERLAGRAVYFVGDGSSDACVLGCPSVGGRPAADAVAVVRGSRLEAACVERGASHRAFDDFAELLDWI